MASIESSTSPAFTFWPCATATVDTTPGIGAHAPALNNAAESCYEGIHTLSALVRRADSTHPRDLDAVVEGAAYDGPRGTVEFRDRVARQKIQLAVADGLDFSIIATL